MDVMLDLETMAVCPTAAIVQIGACLFDPIKLGVTDRFRINVSLQSCLVLGCALDPDTLGWWMHDDQTEARKKVMHEKCESLGSALNSFDKWLYVATKGAHWNLWSHGAAFDVPVLHNAYWLVGADIPWHYRNTRDTRTLFATAQALDWQKPYPPPTHDALQDAVDQATLVQMATRHILKP